MLTVKQMIFSTLLRFCNGAVCLADLWHANDRLTAAGETAALRIARVNELSVGRGWVWSRKWVEDLLQGARGAG